jgi:hypothetical protein
MAVPLTGANSLFVRWGKMGKAVFACNGGQATLATALTELGDNYETSLRDVFATIAASQKALVRGQISPGVLAAAMGQATLLQMMDADTPAAARSVGLAAAELIRQMKASSDTVKVSTVAVTPTAFTSPSNTGTGTLVTSTKRGDGLVNENLVAETGRLTCTNDSYTGSATAGRERFQFLGESPLGEGRFDYLFPTGSGANATVRSVEPTQDASSTGNALTNGDFETWSGSPVQAENWAITTGVWATDIIKDITAGRPRTGLACARWATTAVLSKIDQEFGSSTTTGADAGTGASLIPQTSYAVCLFLRRVSTAITTGTLRVRLIDGTSTTINDTQGTANTFNVTLSALTTSYAAFTGVFRLPAVPPSTIKLRIELTVANDQDFLLDDVMMAPLTTLYTGGPGLAIFAGTTNWITGDGYSIATTNDRGGATYANGTFQTLVPALLGLPTLLLPSASPGTIANTLITA